MKNTLFVSVAISLFGSCWSREQSPNDACSGCLKLSPYIKKGDITTARFLSRVDPQAFFGIESHSGFITVNEYGRSNLFFWFFPCCSLEETPWIIWLQGGPGVSSMMGLFEIIGPFTINDGRVYLRNVTWASNYSILFLDNPVGAGFSFTESEEGYTNNEEDVSGQLLEFLHQFLEVFPELQKAPLFIAGQSYAGKYVPALAIQLHRQKRFPINLRGIAIGNAMMDPRNMMNYSRVCSVLGILGDEEIDELRLLETSTVRLTDEGRMVDAANKFNETIEYIKAHSGVNVYNYLRENVPGKEAKAPPFEIYLNRADVRQLIHVGNTTFNFNNQLVYRKMLPDIMNSTRPLVEELLENYGVMSYSGQMDIIMAYSLARDTYKTLDWSRRSDYVEAPRLRIMDERGSIVAFKKSGGNFVDVLIRHAGHSAPADRPEVTKLVMDTFIQEFK